MGGFGECEAHKRNIDTTVSGRRASRGHPNNSSGAEHTHLTAAQGSLSNRCESGGCKRTGGGRKRVEGVAVGVQCLRLILCADLSG